MPSPMAIADVFGHICNLVGFPGTILGILNIPLEALTIDDLTHVFRGEHARFFNTVTIADIETHRNNFYKVWRPTVSKISTMRSVTRADLSVGGSLYNISTNLSNSITRLQLKLNGLAAVFKQYEPDLLIDELTRGYYGFIEGYTLLFHMHSLHAQFHRINIGADSEQDILQFLQYISEARSILDFFYVESDSDEKSKHVGKVLDRRLRLIESILLPLVLPFPLSFPLPIIIPRRITTDSYKPMKSTEPEFILLAGPFSDNSPVNDRVNAVFRRTQGEVMKSVKPSLDTMEKRLKSDLAKLRGY
ncbi:hypothetical protein F5888DRAFT_182645 [Russula emetica]|nr:hypothetical protein F5888DRAFT_182645 [Russula emetica]